MPRETKPKIDETGGAGGAGGGGGADAAGSLFRDLPSVHQLVEIVEAMEPAADAPRSLVVQAVRAEIDAYREALRSGKGAIAKDVQAALADRALDRLLEMQKPPLRSVINAALARPTLVVPCCNFWSDQKMGLKEMLAAIAKWYTKHQINFDSITVDFKGPYNKGFITGPPN